MDLFDRLRQMHMLLIDDDEWIRNSLSLFFESEGCHLLALETAEEGLEALKKDGYEVIIADYKLPGMDGLKFFEAIQESHPGAIKVLITAYGSEEVVSALRNLGVHEFIQKPFSSTTIEEALARLIEGRDELSANSDRG